MKSLLISAAAIGLFSMGLSDAQAGGVHFQTRRLHVDVGNPHGGYYGNYGGYYARPYTSHYGGWRGGGYGGGPAHSWHDTSHYDYHPGGYVPHYNHYDYVPGHWDFHQEGHWDHHHH